MSTIKSYTDLSQSKTLSKILPLESADMYWFRDDTETPKMYPKDMMKDSVSVTLPCWSLAALLGVLPDNYIDVDDALKHVSLMKTRDGCYMVIYSAFQHTSLCNDPIDACYEMILKLHELNLL